VAAAQSSCSFICCSGMWTEMTRCGEQWKKLTPWWNQEVKDAIRAKKVACKAWRHNKADSSLHSQYTEARKPAALMVKKSNLGHKMDSNY